MSTERLSDEQKCGLCADHLPCPYHGTLAEAVAPATPSEFVPSPVEGPHDHKGYSEEKCVRCGWVMGGRALNCMNNDTPHVFPSQLPVAPVGDEPNPYRFTIDLFFNEHTDDWQVDLIVHGLRWPEDTKRLWVFAGTEAEAREHAHLIAAALRTVEVEQ